MSNALQQQIPIRVDQGLDDEFLSQQLNPESLKSAADHSSYPLQLKMHKGYDHSYYFISTFIEQHLIFHRDYFI